MLHKNIRLRGDHTIHGRGLAAVGEIKAGEVVSRLEPNQPMHPLGEVLAMSDDEIEDMLHFCYQYDEERIVCEQDDGKFMNHSCDPNTWWIDDDTMIARRDIQPGEEITYDYATTEVDVPMAMDCNCGSAICRHHVTNLDYRLPEWQARFGDHLPSHTLRAIAALKEREG